MCFLICGLTFSGEQLAYFKGRRQTLLKRAWRLTSKTQEARSNNGEPAQFPTARMASACPPSIFHNTRAAPLWDRSWRNAEQMTLTTDVQEDHYGSPSANAGAFVFPQACQQLSQVLGFPVLPVLPAGTMTCRPPATCSSTAFLCCGSRRCVAVQRRT